jgi:DNA-binding NarL/FixJ family response regulator
MAPRLQRTIATYGVHQLDNTREELLPRVHREAAADDPWLSPLKSVVVIECQLKIDWAARNTSTAVNTEVDFDLRGFCQDAELTERQTDVIVLTGEGWSQRAIADWLEISQPAVCKHLSIGRSRLAGWLPLVVFQRLTALEVIA